jgi:hypothetical protein
MSCQSERHTLPNGDIRMDLHCWNKDCPSLKTQHIYYPHVGVIVKPNQPWICDRYNLPFIFDGNHYALEGEYTVKHYGKPDMTSKKYTALCCFREDYPSFYLSAWFRKIEIMRIDFAPISTGDDMHEQAWKLFYRLKNIIIFA